MVLGKSDALVGSQAVLPLAVQTVRAGPIAFITRGTPRLELAGGALLRRPEEEQEATKERRCKRAPSNSSTCRSAASPSSTDRIAQAKEFSRRNTFLLSFKMKKT
ncbi:hypothetical protein XELAEV_18025250mg [Xenopus laevis]|uniref:Uncharacterized protein n=1 Tax=Xenopus laevis TaxID=8355 RepID=A0A974D1D0_XENLA|nr:hypothetical protein XELAEV_18025250mg [Xenopus laevis]